MASGMANLAETQQQLFHYLQGKTSSIESLVTGRTEREVKRRLLIYREAYQLRLKAHLTKQFPVLRGLMQRIAFEALAMAYLTAYPPSHFAIRNFGDQLSVFLKDAYPAYYSELATLEWLLNEIIDQSASAPVLTVAQLSQLKPEDLANTCFQLQAHVRIAAFQYDMPPWRDQAKKSLKNIKPPLALSEMKHYALWRKGFQTYYRSLDPLECQFFYALQAGKNFSELCALETDQEDPNIAAQRVVQTLLMWINDGWFTGT